LDLQTLRQTASHVLAAAVFETFPLVDLWISEATDLGFVCECYFPHPVHPDTLPLIEQKMKEIVREARPIRMLEMVPISASAFLKKEGHEEQSAYLLEVEKEGSLVELVEMGAFHQLTEGALLSNTSGLAAFKLLSINILPNQGLRIEGAASFSKEELKKFLKILSLFEKNNYQKVGAKRGFWKCWKEGVVWLPKGLQARESLRQVFFQDLPLVECSELSDELLLRFQKNCRFIKANSTKNLRTSSASMQQILFSPREEMIKSMNSSLHSIYKTLIMLGFDCWVRLIGKRRAWKGAELPGGVRIEKVEEEESRIDIMTEDSLMRPIQIASLRGVKGSLEKKDALICEAFIERILVLMLEKNLRTTFF
jgi:hypothetical protein